MKKVVLLVPSAIACLLLGSACSKPAPAKAEFRIGDAAAAGPLTYTVTEARWVSQLEGFPTPRLPERNFLLIHVTVTNSGGSDVSVPFFKLENSTGDVYEESNNGIGVDRWFGVIRRLGPAQSQDAWVLFDVPTNSYKLRVTDGKYENEHVAYISIPLSMQTDTPPPQTP